MINLSDPIEARNANYLDVSGIYICPGICPF